jgi:hypothetical protein
MVSEGFADLSASRRVWFAGCWRCRLWYSTFVKSLRMALIVHAFQRVQNPSRISKADKLATSATLLLLSNPPYLDIVIRFDMLISAATSAKSQL